jgi:hypothetical protein
MTAADDVCFFGISNTTSCAEPSSTGRDVRLVAVIELSWLSFAAWSFDEARAVGLVTGGHWHRWLRGRFAGFGPGILKASELI